MVKLIASDLDGTLLQNGATTVPEEFIQTIKDLKEKGILFAACSGRQYYNLYHLFEEVKDDIAYVAENGALTIYKGEIINREEIPTQLGHEIIRLLEEEPGTEALVSGTYTTYINPKEDLFRQRIHDLKNQYEVIDDLMNIGEPYIKIALFEKTGTEGNDRQAYWQAKMPEPVKVVTSGAQWLDMLFPWTHKGVGIEALAGHLGIAKEEIMAFGDNINDTEMFEASGIRVAVDNAKPAILEMCEHHTDTVNHFVRKYVFGE